MTFYQTSRYLVLYLLHIVKALRFDIKYIHSLLAVVLKFYIVCRSFAIPDGLVMDPMAPTALAVSSEFMERFGNGLTLLRGHGKKLQKVHDSYINPSYVQRAYILH